jgi:hypothetical protein
MKGAPPVPPDVLELVPPPAPAVVALLVALAVLLVVDAAPPVPAVLLAVVDAAPPGPEPVPVVWFVASPPPQPAYIPARPTEARKPNVAAREAMLVKDRSMLASIPQARILVLGSAP